MWRTWPTLSAKTVAQKPGESERPPLSSVQVLAVELDCARSDEAVAITAAIAIRETDAKAAARLACLDLKILPIPGVDHGVTPFGDDFASLVQQTKRFDEAARYDANLIMKA